MLLASSVSGLFKWRQFEPEVILLAVGWYLRFSRDVEELLAERGLHADHVTVWRWVQRYAPEMERRLRSRLRPTNDSWRVDGGLGALFPNIRTIIADAGHQSRKLARHLLQQDGWKLEIVKRRQRAFKITGLTWIVERSFAWLGRNRRLSKDYEYSVQTSETLIDIAATRLILNRLASA